MSNLAPVNTLWVGPNFGPIERACLRSFLNVGHPVRLFLYETINSIPSGIEVHDARDVLPETAIVRHCSGSLALFSDYFRYKLQALNAGYWVDTDIYCLRPFDFSDPIVVGWESDTYCNGAVLRLAPESQLLIALLSIFEECLLPAWFPLRDRIGFVLDMTQGVRFKFWSRLSAATRQNFSRHRLPKDLQWGIAGPRAITYYVDLFGLRDKVKSREVFYPVHHEDACWIRDPTKSIESMVAPNTRAIHLWNYMLGSIKESSVPSGSFLSRLYREGN